VPAAPPVLGEVIARGREAEIVDAGPGLVLRRYRAPRCTVREAAVMQHAGAHGVRVPTVHEVTADGMVMERLDGPTLMDWALRRPVPRLRRAAHLLAEIHHTVHAVPALDWLPAPAGEGPALLHRDLHPLNVLMTADGPVVIDWTGAARGPAAADVAMAWVIMATSEIPGGAVTRTIAGLGRRLFVRGFLDRAGRHGAASLLHVTGALRIADPNVTDGERAAVRRLVEAHARPAPGSAPPGVD
jgi:aminoglycoside phosphotransferase (APT) family kinase protein